MKAIKCYNILVACAHLNHAIDLLDKYKEVLDIEDICSVLYYINKLVDSFEKKVNDI